MWPGWQRRATSTAKRGFVWTVALPNWWISTARPSSTSRPSGTAGVLASGTHTLCISWSGYKNPAAAATNIGVDAFDIMGTLNAAPVPPAMPARYQNTDSRLVYVGPWGTSYTYLASGGNFRYLNAAGSVTVNFDGTYLAWVTKKHPAYGIASLVLDGGAPVTVDLYRSAQTQPSAGVRHGDPCVWAPIHS